MLPYADDTPSFSPPAWVIVLVGLNIIVFILSFSGGLDHYVRTIFTYGTIPARFFQSADQELDFDTEISSYLSGAGVDQSDWVSPFATLITAMFLHGGIFHIIGNMWFLWLFGDNVEDRLGKIVFPVFYMICGLVAGLLHVVFMRDSVQPAIGASGAIAGIMGAYIYMFPRSTLASLISWGFFITTVHLPAAMYLGLWFVLQLFGGLAAGGASNVAFWAHIGGFLAGLFLAMLLKSLGMINWYPGDSGYKGPGFTDRKPRRGSLPPGMQAPRRRRRYVWHE